MPDHEPTSPWSSQAHHEAYARAVPPAPDQPAHAWISSDPYAVAPPPAVPVPAPGPAPVPIEVRVAAPSGGGRGLAILGVVLGGLALLIMAFVLVFVVFMGVMDDGSSDGGYGPVRGTIAPATGSALTGDALAEEVTRKITDDGGEPEDVTCPATAKVAQDVTTVCHGTDYGDDAAFVVFFEDEKGAYTLLEV